MSLPREALGAKLRPLLSEDVGRGCVELLTLAGLPSGRGYAQTAAVALNELVAKGLARREKPYGHGPQFFAVPAPAAASEERVGLPELDAILVFKTTIGRPFGAPSDRTTVTCTALLGPSWPEGTRVPPWSTGLFASQVAAGGLGAAKANGTTRLRAALSALRADPTPPPPPSPPEVPVSDPDLISALLSYCAGVAGGAKDSSVHSWLKARRVSRIRAEELLEQLVSEGRLQLVEKPIAGGEVVVRYLPAEAVEPAPLPTSDAPPEEPAAVIDAAAMVEEALPLEEPIMPAGAAEPCEECEYLRLQLNAPCQECERLRQERDMAQGEAHGLRHHLHEVNAERDELREQLAASAAAVADAGRQYTYLLDAWQRLCHLLDVPSDRIVPAIDRVRLLVAGAQASAEHTTNQGDSQEQFATKVASWLVDLSDEKWKKVAQARASLLRAKKLREESHTLERGALDDLDRAVANKKATRPTPTRGTAEPSDGTQIALVTRALRDAGDARASEIAQVVDCPRKSADNALRTLVQRGLATLVAPGLYRAVVGNREAAE